MTPVPLDLPLTYFDTYYTPLIGPNGEQTDLESLGLDDREIPPEKITKLSKIGSGGFKDVFIGRYRGKKVCPCAHLCVSPFVSKEERLCSVQNVVSQCCGHSAGRRICASLIYNKLSREWEFTDANDVLAPTVEKLT